MRVARERINGTASPRGGLVTLASQCADAFTSCFRAHLLPSWCRQRACDVPGVDMGKCLASSREESLAATAGGSQCLTVTANDGSPPGASLGTVSMPSTTRRGCSSRYRPPGNG